MHVSKSYEGWDATPSEIDQVVQLFVSSRESSHSVTNMTVTASSGEEWTFDAYADFLDELSRPRQEFYIRLDAGDEDLVVCDFGSGPDIEVGLSTRSELEDFLTSVAAIVSGETIGDFSAGEGATWNAFRAVNSELNQLLENPGSLEELE